ncbi:phage tail assembly protein [Burkholderia sp. TSV86]|uniref:phage tail assembly protein n=1 Tax=Burkholderia sp. TSV86 TaxID=1385594 RepID=UPI0007585842|nr:phage tail assembly protein [Burkholderia sp. TSV86]KVE33907.1 hypothetical protein WS68_00865 [Burkholderia sp. TSV86]
MSAKKETWLKENGDGSVTITLSKPLEVNGVPLQEVTMREPTLDDQVASNEARGSDVLKEITLFANLCTVAPADLRRLKLRDYLRLQAAFGNFLD